MEIIYCGETEAKGAGQILRCAGVEEIPDTPLPVLGSGGQERLQAQPHPCGDAQTLLWGEGAVSMKDVAGVQVGEWCW